MRQGSKSHAATAFAVPRVLEDLGISDQEELALAEAFDHQMDIFEQHERLHAIFAISRMKYSDFGIDPSEPMQITPVDTTPDWKHPIPTNRMGNTPSLEARLKARAKRKKRK